MRDHQPIVIEEFNGLWKRGDDEAAPPDHFTDCNNIQYFHSGFRTRDGLDTYRAIGNVLRLYTYIMQTGESLLILVEGGAIYHAIGETILYGPILTIAGMTDFAFVSFAGRAYISPHDGEKGLENQFLYVYAGDGTPARKAGGTAPSTALTAANSGAAGFVEAGVHLFSYVYETNTGFLSEIAPPVALTVPGGKKVDLSGITTSPSSYVTARRIVATRAIDPTLYTGDLQGYQFFFVPDGKINNNTATTLTVDFFDADLLDDASHLFDIFGDIPAGVGLNTYHNRLLIWTTHKDISLVYASAPGEPEAINEIDGLMIVSLDGKPITYAQEFRDVLYVMKLVRTYAFNDNGDVPSSWPMTVIDQGIGCSVHGVATILDSGGVNIDYLTMTALNGIMLFNGTYLRPELSWKMRDYWLNEIPRTFFLDMQIHNDTLRQIIYCTLPDRKILFGDYSNGNLDPKEIKWGIWSFDVKTTSISLIDKNTLIIGAHE